MDRITFLICHILKPLLDHIPSHLKNTHDALVKLQAVPKEKLKGKTFFTADVEALYTNINVETAINNIMDFASENKQHLNLYGLTLTDIHELMEISLLNSYFVYDRQVYIQLQGFFMGVRPAPIGAIIKMWTLEKYLRKVIFQRAIVNQWARVLKHHVTCVTPRPVSVL